MSYIVTTGVFTTTGSVVPIIGRSVISFSSSPHNCGRERANPASGIGAVDPSPTCKNQHETT